jgi:hypothetical protein
MVAKNKINKENKDIMDAMEYLGYQVFEIIREDKSSIILRVGK